MDPRAPTSISGSTRDRPRGGYVLAVELIRRRWPDLAVLILAGWVLASAVVASDPTVRVGLLVMTLALLTLLGRRRVGLISIVVCFGAMAVAMHLVPNAPASMFLGTLAGFAAAGGTATRREAAIGWAVGTAVVLVTLLNSPTTDGASDIVLTLAFCTTVWAAALVATERGRQVLSARRRVALVEDPQPGEPCHPPFMRGQVVVVDRLMAWSCRRRFHRWGLLPGRIPCDHARLANPSLESAQACSPDP